jgi:hypothetical protein
MSMVVRMHLMLAHQTEARQEERQQERLAELTQPLRCLHERNQTLYWLEDDGRVGTLSLADRTEATLATLELSFHRTDGWLWQCAWTRDDLLASTDEGVFVVSLSSGRVQRRDDHERFTVSAGGLRWIEHTGHESLLHVAADGDLDGGETRPIGCGDLALGVGERTALLVTAGNHSCGHGVTFLGADDDARVRTGNLGDYVSDDEALYVSAEDDAFNTERRWILRITP